MVYCNRLGLHQLSGPLNWLNAILPGRNYIHPPPLPHFWPKDIFQGRGVGVYILRPHAAGILYAPPFYTPPTPRRVFSGGGGVGVYKNLALYDFRAAKKGRILSRLWLSWFFRSRKVSS